jgi:hypothetical protein
VWFGYAKLADGRGGGGAIECRKERKIALGTEQNTN